MATQFFTAFYTAPRLINEDLVYSFFSFDSRSSSVRVFFRRAILSYGLASAIGVILVVAVLTAFANAQTAEKIVPQDAKQSGSSPPAETEKMPHKSNCSKPNTASKRTAIHTKKSTRVSELTTNSVSANSPD